MIILISNDDGIASEGLASLGDSLEPLGDIWTVAPERAQNAVGRALTLHRPLMITELSKRRFMVNGTPSDCVNIAVNSLLPEKPALVVSGINKGANLADDIPYSGTVAAAFEATILQIPAFAVSLACRKDFVFGPAGRFAARLAESVLMNGLPQDTLLNIYVPDTQGADITSCKITQQGKCIYAGSITEASDPRGQKYYWIGGKDVKYQEIPESDSEAVSRNHISITPLKTDLTNYAEIQSLINLLEL